MAPDDRERNFEQALARNLRANLPDSESSSHDRCPDAEILAAYHERLLAQEEMISSKEHIAACSRCQEILAHLEAIDEIPVEHVDLVKDEELAHQVVFVALSSQTPRAASPYALPAVSKSAMPLEMPRRAASWRWLAPAGALAAILLVWVAAHERTSPPMQLAKNHSTPNPLAPPPAASASPSSAKKESPSQDLRTPSTLQGRPSAKTDALKRDESSKLGDTVLPSFSSGKAAAPRRALPTGAAAAAPLNTAPAPPRILTESPIEEKPLATHSTAPEPPPSTLSAASDSAASSVAVLPQSQDGARAKSKSVGALAAAPPFQEQSGSLGDAIAPRETVPPNQSRVTSPDGTSTWQLAPGGIIQHSSDSGSTWTVQPSGVVADLLAGSASSNSICWLVGRNGAILRTTDGGNHWQKVPSPATGDLTSVFAVDAKQATITAASTHKTYKTSDAGQTWTALPTP